MGGLIRKANGSALPGRSDPQDGQEVGGLAAGRLLELLHRRDRTLPGSLPPSELSAPDRRRQEVPAGGGSHLPVRGLQVQPDTQAQTARSPRTL